MKSIDKTSVGKFDKKDLRAHLAEGEYNIIRLKGPGESQRLDVTGAADLSRENRNKFASVAVAAWCTSSPLLDWRQ